MRWIAGKSTTGIERKDHRIDMTGNRGPLFQRPPVRWFCLPWRGAGIAGFFLRARTKALPAGGRRTPPDAALTGLSQQPVDALLFMREDALFAEVFQYPQQLPAADVQVFRAAGDIGDGVAHLKAAEGASHALLQGHGLGVGHGVVELGGQAETDIAEKDRVL